VARRLPPPKPLAWASPAPAWLLAGWLAWAAPSLPAAAATTTLSVYFNHAQRAGTEVDCTTVFPVPRQVPRTEAVATAALQQLFAGPTEDERVAGYRSPFSAASAGLLKRVRIDHGTAYVDLHDLRARLGGATSSCGAAEFHMQVERTLRQFPSVRRVILAIDGEPRAFYDWMGESCDLSNDRCDAAPFTHRR
jgi:spore germination protein GerM